MTAADIPDDILAPIEAIATAYNAKATQAAVSDKAASDAEGDAADLRVQLAAAEAEILALQPKPVAVKTVFGAAATNDAAFAKLGVNSARIYNGEGVVPAKFTLTRSSVTNHVELSIKPHHPPQAGGFDQDDKVVAYVTSAAAVCKAAGLTLSVIWIHEPENKTKQPADAPAPYAAAVVHYVQLVHAQFPDLEQGVCFMAYTFDQRPDTKGTNPWLVAVLAAAKAAGVVLSFYGLDGYSTGTNNHATAAAIFGPNIAYIRSMIPNAEIRVPELGHDLTGQGRADWITATIPYLVSEGVTGVYWFSEGSNDITGDPVSLAAWKAAIKAAA